VADGKLYILVRMVGHRTGSHAAPSAIKVMVDWHEFNSSHHWKLFLEDADGQPVCFDTPDGPQPIEVRAISRQVGLMGAGRYPPVALPIAVSFGRFLAGRLQFHVAW